MWVGVDGARMYGEPVLREVTATRYVTPLREGGSLPGIVEADDLGTYVVKFQGAGQGRKALVAEVIAGELGRRLGLRVPELVTVDLDPAIGRLEPDEEIQDLLKASSGLNLGMDYLPGSFGFDPLAWTPDAAFASSVVWFDALIGNVDRDWRNPNLLVWHGNVWLIDHGAALYFHHSWATADKLISRAYDASAHVLAPFATDIAAADARLAPLITEELLTEVISQVPAEWLDDETDSPVGVVRDLYVRWLLARVAEPRTWLPEPRSGPAVAAKPRSGRPDWLA
jgi:hypothetical protein